MSETLDRAATLMSEAAQSTTSETTARLAFAARDIVDDHIAIVEAIRRAWRNPGPRPDFHRDMQAKLRREWPTLANALDALPKGDR